MTDGSYEDIKPMFESSSSIKVWNRKTYAIYEVECED